MRRVHYLYHATTPENAEKILRDGLLRQNKPWVYMSEKPTSWWLPGLDLLRIRITGLKENMQTFLPELDEILYFGDINPARINRADDAIPRRYAQMMYQKYGEDLSISRGHENGKGE